MKRATLCILLIGILSWGCASTPPEFPSSADETLNRMRLLRVKQVDIRQAEILTTLEEFDSLAAAAKLPFHISTQSMREQIAQSQAEWLAIRKPLPAPSRYESDTPKWQPPSPTLTIPIITFTARDVAIHDALTIMCGISGLEWSVDDQSKVVISFIGRRGQ